MLQCVVVYYVTLYVYIYIYIYNHESDISTETPYKCGHVSSVVVRLASVLYITSVIHCMNHAPSYYLFGIYTVYIIIWFISYYI